jgi:hypothetical protein
MAVEVIEVETGVPVRALFTTRAGGTSPGGWASLNLGISSGDALERVQENRRRLAERIGLPVENMTGNYQVHGCDVRPVTGPTPSLAGATPTRRLPEADALVTDTARTGLTVLAADCLPVLAWRVDGSAVAAAHAGWRGLVAGVLENTVTALEDPETTHVAIGPGVRPCCYPVDDVLRREFHARFGAHAVVGAAVDLAAAARTILERVGVPATQIRMIDACTSCESARFFSYRRDGARTGRHAGLIWMED